jgi:hypothetical protein
MDCAVENIKITNFDEAVTHLSESVTNVARCYQPQDFDDISQECWVQIFRLIRSRGEVDSSLLIRTAQYAAKKQSKLLNDAGLTPRRSRFRRPNQLTYLPYEPYEEPLEDLIRDLLIETSGRQHAIVNAARLLISDGRKPTQEAIAEMLRTTRDKVQYQLEKLRKKYNDNNKD